MNKISFLKSASSTLYLYQYGNEFTGITGGWDLFSSAARNADNLLFTCNSTVNGLFVTHNKIDLTPYTTLSVYSKKYPSLGDGGGLLISNSNDSISNIISGYVDAVFLNTSDVTAGWASMDITNRNGLYYVSVYAVYAATTRGSYAYIIKLS